MSAEARTFVNTLSVSDPLSVLILRTIAENIRYSVNSDGARCALQRRQLAAEVKTTLRKLNAGLKKLVEANIIAIDEGLAIELVGFEAFHASLSSRSAAAREVPAQVQSAPATRNVPERSHSKHDRLIDELKTDGLPVNVLETYIRPVATLLIIGHPHPSALFSQICTAIMDYPPHVLEAIKIHTVKTRAKLVSVKQVVDDAAKVLPTVRRFRITKEHHKVQWLAWKNHYDAKGKASLFRYYDGQGYLSEISEWPPEHWQNGSESTSGEEIAA
jgi:hypothetical protein